jgi:hypothetical protein
MNRKSIVGLVILLMSLTASANDLRVMSLDEKVSKSEIVVIGRVVAIDVPGDGREAGWKYAAVEVLQTLKGLPESKINVQYKGPIPEANPACCSVGKNYLFFLQKQEATFYISVNHSFGVYDLTDVNRTERY